MESQVIYFVSYSCPRCKAELEVQHEAWQGWRRCPNCGLSSLPPELLFGHPMTRRRVLGRDDDPVIPDEMSLPDDPIALDRAQVILTSPSGGFGPLRVFFVIGFVVSLFLLLLFYLDQNSQFTGIFGALSFIFFLLMLRSPRRRSRDDD